jgi:hypothetical protein
MKKLSIVVVVVLSLCLVASFAFAGAMKGMVKSVDAAKGSIVITIDGKDQTLSADKGVDLGTVKAGDKVEVDADKGMVKSLKKSKPKAVVGC